MEETKIIKVVFGGRRYAVTNKRARTDYGQMFEFVDIDLPETFEVIFSNSNTSAGTGKKMIGSNQRCLIPDEYLKTGQPIYAWILLHDTEDDGRHMYSIRIPVADMPDTSPEEPTPVEQSVISQAITALNSAVTTTTQKAQEATESADRAEQAAEGVEGFAERAESAQQAAESARDIALEAKVSAQASAATASEKASEAISSATTASQSALTAENASESASASEQMALGYAESAQDSARQARDYSTVAVSNANSASQSASQASQKALEASQSASTAVQAKTDAITAKTASETAQGLAESARDEAVTAKTGAETARNEAQSIADGITGKVEQIDSNTDRIESLEDDRYKPYPTDTASGAVASFSDGADDIPLKSCIVRVEPKQEGSGDPSPDNVRPITGWTGCEVQRTGKNLFGGEAFRDAVLAAVSTATTGEDENGRYVTITAGPASNGNVIFKYPFKENAVYTFVCRYKKNNTNGITNIGIRYKDKTEGYISRTGEIQANVVYTTYFKNVKDISYVMTLWASGTATIYYDDFGVFEGDISVDDFTPYTGQTYPITFPSEAGTIYGGYIDPINGELVTCPYYASYNGETLTGEWISDRDKYVAGTTPTIGAQVVNIGAVGERYPITPQEIKTLLGTNNVWANTGDTEVEYRADVTLYINKKIAEAVSALT